MLLGCGASDSGIPGKGPQVGTTPGEGGSSSTSSGSGAGGSGGNKGVDPRYCPSGLICPAAFPFHHDGDTSTSTSRQFDSYSCATGTDESGPEMIYRVSLSTAGFLSAAVNDDTANVDIDLHILSTLDAAACLDRGDRHVRAHVNAGVYYVVADTYVSGGTEFAGPYGLDIGFIIPAAGNCAMTQDVVERVVGPPLQLPTDGPIVKEAHLVTVADGYGDSWPNTIDEGVPQHYKTSFAATSFVMARNQSWAPQESCEFGQGATGGKLPLIDESWYINMYWKDRPPGGTRMIVQLPGGGPAVVTSAGYETGPGNPDHIAGTTEEVHFYFGTGHLDQLRIGFAVDQNLPLGPITCTP